MNKQFVIRRDGIAVHFTHNVAGKFMRGATDAEATKFDAQWLAEDKAKSFNLRPGTFTIEELNPQQITK